MTDVEFALAASRWLLFRRCINREKVREREKERETKRKAERERESKRERKRKKARGDNVLIPIV